MSGSLRRVLFSRSYTHGRKTELDVLTFREVVLTHAPHRASTQKGRLVRKTKRGHSVNTVGHSTQTDSGHSRVNQKGNALKTILSLFYITSRVSVFLQSGCLYLVNRPPIALLVSEINRPHHLFVVEHVHSYLPV